MNTKSCMNIIRFELKPVERIPAKTFKKRSKYDPILDSFLEHGMNIARLDVEGRDPNYIRTQLKKRIDRRGLPIKVSVINHILYLERV